MAARDTHGITAPWGEFRHVGRPVPKIDGLAKATGAAVYADDLTFPGMLHGKTLRSPHPHARVRAVDTSQALKLPGVLAVLTGRDLPVRYGILPWTQDENALAVDKVRFVGDPVAAVAAVDEDTANAALRLLRVDYEVLHAYLDPFEALRRHDPAIHEDRKEGNIS
jgi:CO/xanthine dehydrogenase Mo-binding subunit